MKVKKEDFLKYINETTKTPEFNEADILELSIFEYEKDNGDTKYFFTIDFEIDDGLIANNESLEEL